MTVALMRQAPNFVRIQYNETNSPVNVDVQHRHDAAVVPDTARELILYPEVYFDAIRHNLQHGHLYHYPPSWDDRKMSGIIEFGIKNNADINYKLIGLPIPMEEADQDDLPWTDDESALRSAWIPSDMYLDLASDSVREHTCGLFRVGLLCEGAAGDDVAKVNASAPSRAGQIANNDITIHFHTFRSFQGSSTHAVINEALPVCLAHCLDCITPPCYRDFHTSIEFRNDSLKLEASSECGRWVCVKSFLGGIEVNPDCG